ncbi:MAG: hypothetical protein U5K31_04035 [Balneolaceae bacterium]|nr:hypothetical protein [Balneolaceae bacterium]
MTTKFKSLKEQLRSLENESGAGETGVRRRPREGILQAGFSASNWIKYVLLIGFLTTFLIYAGNRYTDMEIQPDLFPTFELFSNSPSPQLLQAMGASMEEMGYTGLTEEDLLVLREQGVTATYTRAIRALGYDQLTLDQVTRLAQEGVSSTFAAMMQELGYELSVDELIQLERAGVTAFFTSNMHDLGYPDITMDELIRLRNVGATSDDVESLIEQNPDGELPTIEEIIRYRISNQ